MHGHEPLIALRMSGHVPASVHVDADGVLPRRITRSWPVQIHPGSRIHAHLCIGPREPVSMLDLRCLVGLRVFVHGANVHRVAEVAKACAAAKAREVYAAVAQPNVIDGEVQTWEEPCTS